MKGGGAIKQEFDELDTLFGEIPNATSASPHSDQSVLTSIPLPKEFVSPGEREQRLSPSSTSSNNHRHSPRATDISVNMSFQKNLNNVNSSSDQNIQKTRTVDPSYSREDVMLPDDHSLTSAFENLGFNDVSVREARKPNSTEYDKIVHNQFYPFSQPFACMNKSVSRQETNSIDLFPNALSMANRDSNDKLNLRMNRRGNESFFSNELNKEGSESLVFNLQEQRLKLSMHSATLPMASGLQVFPLPSGSSAPTPRLDFQAQPYQQPPYQQPCYVDPHSPAYPRHAYHLSCPDVTWQNPEEEQYLRMHQQYGYLQLLQNQLQNPKQAVKIPSYEKANGALFASTRKPCLTYFETGQFECRSQHVYRNDGSGNKSFDNLESEVMDNGLCRNSVEGFCSKGDNCAFAHGHKQTSFNDLPYPKHDSKRTEMFPEKILTRSPGLSSQRNLKSGGISSACLRVDSKNMLLPTSQSRCTFGVNSKPFQLNRRDMPGHLSDNIEFNYTSKSPLPKFNSLDEVAGRIFYMAKDQNGCRFLQKKFIEGTPEDVEKIFVEIIDHMGDLMTDPFGNYLVQKLLEKCSEDQRMRIICAITSDRNELIKISCDMHGTRAVQKVIETLSTPDQFSRIVMALKPGIIELMKNTNGNHVAQRCLLNLSPEYSTFLYAAAVAHCLELGTDRHGCCVLQKCLILSNKARKHQLLYEIVSNAYVLSKDPYGNYVVQFALAMKIPWATKGILNQLMGRYGNLSTGKYSSNVVEKCIVVAGEEERSRIIMELINHPKLSDILQDPFGNYVVQSALQECKGTLHTTLVEAIRPHLPTLRSSHYGKKILYSTTFKK